MIVSAPRGMARHSLGRQQALRGLGIAFDRGVEKRPHELGARGVLGGRIAPRAQRVTELERYGHVREGVEIDEAQRAVRIVSEQKVRDLRVAVHDAVGARRQRRQGFGGLEHALGERLDDVEVPVPAVLAERVAQSAQMPRRVVHAETAVAEPMLEIAHGAMELRQQAAGGARLRGCLERVAADAVDARERAPDAVVLDPQRTGRRRHQPRREQALAGQVLGDGCDVDVHLGGEDGVHALQHECGTVPGLRIPRGVHEARRRPHERLGLELEGCEHALRRYEIWMGAHAAP